MRPYGTTTSRITNAPWRIQRSSARSAYPQFRTLRPISHHIQPPNSRPTATSGQARSRASETTTPASTSTSTTRPRTTTSTNRRSRAREGRIRSHSPSGSANSSSTAYPSSEGTSTLGALSWVPFGRGWADRSPIRFARWSVK